MQLKYGSYEFDSNACTIATRVEPLWNAGGQIYAHRWVYDVDGYLSGSGQADLATKERQLRNALEIPRRDLILYQDDGSASAIALKNQGSITGVKVTRGPDFARTQGPEYATERHFTLTAEAEYPVVNDAVLLLDYTESVRTSGGGPLFIHKPAIKGPPQKQKLYDQLPYLATQSGTATGYRRYPTPPPPLWPFALKQAPQIEQTSPSRVAKNKWQGWRISWTYEFESATPLVGSPNLWR